MENKNLQVQYQNSNLQLQKQKHTLNNFCKNDYELSLVNAVFSENTINHENLIDILARWRWMVGVVNQNQNDDEVAQELVLLSKFVKSNYTNLTIDEINLAIELSLTDKLDCDTKTYNVFSAMYVSRILNSYMEYKRKINKELVERKSLAEIKETVVKDVTPQEKMDSMIELIRYLYDDYKEKGFVNDYFNTLYNYFRRTNRLNPDKETVNNALLHAKNETSNHINSYFAMALKEEKPNRQTLEKRYARNYCVKLYFDQIDIEELIKTITINEFD